MTSLEGFFIDLSKFLNVLGLVVAALAMLITSLSRRYGSAEHLHWESLV